MGEWSLTWTLHQKQGLTGRHRPAIWLRGDGMYQVVEERLRREGIRFRDAADVWGLLRQFRPVVKGMVLYKLGTPSLNVGRTLALLPPNTRVVTADQLTGLLRASFGETKRAGALPGRPGVA